MPNNLYYRWNKDFLESGKKRLAGDNTREASSHEVVDLKIRTLKTDGTDFRDIDI
jgi:hypothetical protein